jgi:murein DD-endopeptidase MepM/ murein hydrolase activator NlpD
VGEIPTEPRLEGPSASVIQGGVFTVTLKTPQAASDVTGQFLGKDLTFFPDPLNGQTNSANQRFSALVGVEYWAKLGEIPVLVQWTSEGKKQEKSIPITVVAGEFPSEQLTVPPRTIEPTAKDKIRIAAESKVIGAVYAHKTLHQYWDHPMLKPVDNPITSVFGTFRVYNGKKLNPHLGTDLRAPVGHPILAPTGGKVVLARNLFYTGYTVILDHGYGLFTIYGHMSKLKVKEGAEVKKGILIGLAGATGRASGPHLHWGVNLHGVKVDPFSLMEALK